MARKKKKRVLTEKQKEALKRGRAKSLAIRKAKKAYIGDFQNEKNIRFIQKRI